MKKLALLLVSMLNFVFPQLPRRKTSLTSFYGFVRGDLFYNTRANMAPVDGNFYLSLW